MTISPKRIERLWEACPELRPDEDTGLGHFEIRAIHHDGRDAFIWFNASANTDEDEDGNRMFESPVTAHALIRDKIVWWLSDTKNIDCLVLVISTNGSQHFVNLHEVGRVHTTDFEGKEPAPQKDSTEACILAAERALGLPEWTE